MCGHIFDWHCFKVFCFSTVCSDGHAATWTCLFMPATQPSSSFFRLLSLSQLKRTCKQETNWLLSFLDMPRSINTTLKGILLRQRFCESKYAHTSFNTIGKKSRVAINSMLCAVVSAQSCSVHCTLNDTPENWLFLHYTIQNTHTNKQTVVTLPGIVILPALPKPISPQKLEYCVKYKIVMTSTPKFSLLLCQFLKDFIWILLNF